MYRLFSVFVAMLLVTGISCHSQPVNEENLFLGTFHSVSSHDLLNYAAELSSQQYGGRLSGSPGYQKAAEWVAGKLREWGIEQGNHGSYFQFFDNPYTEVFSAGQLTWHKEGSPDSVVAFRFSDDYFPGSNSASGTVTGGLVYTGYGISAPELNYDDYAGVNVSGKIVLMETGIPYTGNDSTLVSWTPYAYHRYKFLNAMQHGAAGLLYIGRQANPNTSYLDKFVYAHIDPRVAENFFNAAGKDYAVHKKAMTANRLPASLDLGQKVTVSASTRHHPGSRSCNVVGLLKGSDPELQKEVIIIGGHLDGQGTLGGTLFPGALDNASGVADILGTARALAASEIKPARSVLFIFFGGEECGLYGSYLYTREPLFEKDKTICMVNLDMVGNGTGFFLSSGLSYPNLYSHFTGVNNRFIHRPMQSSEKRNDYGRPRSDAAVFEKAGYKTIGLWTSESVKPVYYHHPDDNTDSLTPEIMEDAARLLYLVVLGIANDKQL